MKKGPRPDAVIKVGGSVLRDETDYRRVAARLQPWTEQGAWIVVSAAYGITDQLNRLATSRSLTLVPDLVARHARLGGNTLPHELVAELTSAVCSASNSSAIILSWGERASAWALREQLSMIGVHLPIAELPSRGLPPTHRGAIVPGFYVRDPRGRVGLLPRGGSDISAVLLAKRLHATEVRLWKDGGGIRSPEDAARTVPETDGSDLLARLETSIRPLHPAALRLALREGLDLILEDPLGRHPSTRVRGLALEPQSSRADERRPEMDAVALVPRMSWGGR